MEYFKVPAEQLEQNLNDVLNMTSDNGSQHDAKLPVSRPLCPTCKKDTLIRLSGITYCMVDGCDGVKGHNVG